ncbi:MAG: NupC/NupG family nucleoside CNT transporter [Shewanellaceae bacterium]|nr:NupC/NupG family nucleoside CNT transporter [Shewanellaceae bacterium]
MDILMSLMGIAALLGIAAALSSNRKAINFRTVTGAFALQIGFAFLVMYIPMGQHILKSISDGVSSIIGYANQGVVFVFGDIGMFKMGFIFAFHVLTTIIFFSSLIAVLYHFGIMQLVIKFIGGGLHKLLGTSKTESLSATANIFVGHTEAPLVIRPYLANMTESELFAVMAGGMASIAGTVLAGYAQMGVPMEYLVSASFMAAPGGLLMAKIMVPETEHGKHVVDDIADGEMAQACNVVDAAAMGASSGLTLAANIGAMLLAFVGLIAMANGMLSGVGGLFGAEWLTIEWLLGWAFAPFAFVIGIPWNEAFVAGSLIGQKLLFSEFIAFQNLSPYLQDVTDGGLLIEATGLPMTERTRVIIVYALCGFANIGSFAILLGGIGTLAPNRRHDIARLGMKAIVAGSLSNFMSGTIAGLIFLLQ